jgi:hypothetical protein
LLKNADHEDLLSVLDQRSSGPGDRGSLCCRGPRRAVVAQGHVLVITPVSAAALVAEEIESRSGEDEESVDLREPA